MDQVKQTTIISDLKVLSSSIMIFVHLLHTLEVFVGARSCPNYLIDILDCVYRTFELWLVKLLLRIQKLLRHMQDSVEVVRIHCQSH
ncbi:unnamed protein product [Lathyrus oleraceus]